MHAVDHANGRGSQSGLCVVAQRFRGETKMAPYGRSGQGMAGRMGVHSIWDLNLSRKLETGKPSLDM